MRPAIAAIGVFVSLSIGSASALAVEPLDLQTNPSEEILSCYHPTATFERASEHIDAEGMLAAMLKSPQGAVRAGYIDIYYTGIMGTPYRVSIGVDVRWEASESGKAHVWSRFVVLRDSALIPANPNCYMKDWSES